MAQKLEELIIKEKSFLIAAGTYTAARVLDITSTYMVLSDTSQVTFEENPVTRMFIREFGLIGGLSLINILTLPTLLAVAYHLNKEKKGLNGKSVLYIGSGLSILASIYNLYQ